MDKRSALFYTYIGYPIFVYLVSVLFPRKDKKSLFEPNVTVLITAYNEEKDIRAKLENTLQLIIRKKNWKFWSRPMVRPTKPMKLSANFPSKA